MRKGLTRGLQLLPVIVLLMMGIGYLFAPNDPYHVDMAKRFMEPSLLYPLGTDHMGRCVLSRLLYGGRATLGVVFVSALVASLIGGIIGLLIGQYKVKDNVLVNSLLCAVTAIPPIAYLIIFISAWGIGPITMVLAISFVTVLRLIKVVKARTEVELGKAYVMCSVAAGASKIYILFREVLPNIFLDMVRFLCLSCAEMIIAIVGFSYIGLGLGDNVIDWGGMVLDGHPLVIAHPELTLYPMIPIFLCTLALNIISRKLEKREIG